MRFVRMLKAPRDPNTDAQAFKLFQQQADERMSRRPKNSSMAAVPKTRHKAKDCAGTTAGQEQANQRDCADEREETAPIARS